MKSNNFYMISKDIRWKKQANKCAEITQEKGKEYKEKNIKQ